MNKALIIDTNTAKPAAGKGASLPLVPRPFLRPRTFPWFLRSLAPLSSWLAATIRCMKKRREPENLRA